MGKNISPFCCFDALSTPELTWRRHETTRNPRWCDEVLAKLQLENFSCSPFRPVNMKFSGAAYLTFQVSQKICLETGRGGGTLTRRKLHLKAADINFSFWQMQFFWGLHRSPCEFFMSPMWQIRYLRGIPLINCTRRKLRNGPSRVMKEIRLSPRLAFHLQKYNNTSPSLLCRTLKYITVSIHS